MILETTYEVLITFVYSPSSIQFQLNGPWCSCTACNNTCPGASLFYFGVFIPFRLCIYICVTLFIQPSQTKISSDSPQRNAILFWCLHSHLLQRISAEFASTMAAIILTAYRKGKITSATNLGLII
jgi:hypothetical protein